VGFKGSRKGTPFAATQAALAAANVAAAMGMRACDVRVKGPGAARESAIRAIGTVGIEVKSNTATSRRFRTTGAGPPSAGGCNNDGSVG